MLSTELQEQDSPLPGGYMKRFPFEHFSKERKTYTSVLKFIMIHDRVAELGSLLSGAKMAMKISVKRVFTIFVSNASFLRVIANLQN